LSRSNVKPVIVGLALVARARPSWSPRPVELRRRIVDQPGHPRRAALELGAPIVPGGSGAPVDDVAGIVFKRSTRRGGTAYAVRTDGVGAVP
jgi:hypothetical protein